MKGIHGVCPHCGSEAGCGMLDNKLAASCDACKKPLFDGVRGWLKLMNALFVVPVLTAVAGMWFRLQYGMGFFIAVLIISALLFLTVFLLERLICNRALKGKR